MNTSEALGATMPSQSGRRSITQDPNSGSSGSGTVFVSEAAFKQTADGIANNLANSAGQMDSRNKAVRGIKVKPETYATLEIAEGGQSPSASNAKFTDFLLQSANEVTQERYQLIETFGDPIGFFFGTRPKIYQYSGVLLNTSDFPWRDNWKTKYEEEFRGTKCIDAKKRAYLTYDFVLREGYILGMNIGQISASPNSVDFSFTMFITRELNLAPTDPTHPEDF